MSVEPQAHPRRRASRSATTYGRFYALLAVSAAVLAVGFFLGLVVGSSSIHPGTVLDALTAYDPAINEHRVVVLSRLPRTVLAILVGLALGLAGALMQSITRNPLAEPGLLGVNAGAALAIVIGIAYLGVTSVGIYVWFAFGGAAAAAVVVYLLGSARRGAATPARMLLAGAAVSIAVLAINRAILLSNQSAFDQFRFWDVGSVQGRDFGVILTVLPFLAAGTAVALLLPRGLNVLALGEDVARGMGANPNRTRVAAAIAVVLLAGGATAAAGPIAFVGLAAAHVVRSVVGSDNRLLIPGVLLVAPAFLLLADVFGRAIVAPGELQTGIAVAALGGPIFVLLVRSRRMSKL